MYVSFDPELFPFCFAALHHDFVRAPGPLRHGRRGLQDALVQLDHRQAPAGVPHGEFPKSSARSVSQFQASKCFLFQHHEQVEKYSTTLETLLFTQDLDPNILDVFQQFLALRM